MKQGNEPKCLACSSRALDSTVATDYLELEEVCNGCSPKRKEKSEMNKYSNTKTQATQAAIKIHSEWYAFCCIYYANRFDVKVQRFNFVSPVSAGLI